jgi:anti-sigma B factor antagonist
MADPARLESDHEDGRVVIRLSGEIDLTNVGRLEEQIEGAIADARDVVIDLTEVHFLDSGGLRLLSRVSTAAADHNQSFVVVAPPDSIARSVIDIAGMTGELIVRDAPPGARTEIERSTGG